MTNQVKEKNIRMQVQMDENTHKVLKILSMQSDIPMKYLLEDALKELCLNRFNAKSIGEIVESLNPIFKDEKGDLRNG